MTEIQAIDYIKTEVSKTISGFHIDVISRKYVGMSTYDATIAVILKDDVIIPQTLLDIYNKIKNDSLDIEVVGTSKDIKDLKFEVLTLQATIIIGE